MPGRNASRTVAAAIASCLLVAAAAPGPAAGEPKPDGSLAAAATVEVEARPIGRFEKANPAQRRFGRLEFRGGLVLSSPASQFGGWSGLEVDADGRLLAVSDAGLWLTGRLTYDGGMLAGLQGARMGPLTGLGGAALTKERDRDAEGLALIEGTLAGGTVLISFERNHRIGRFPVSERGVGAPTGYLPLPPETRRQSQNKSLEAVCVLAGGLLQGAVVTLSERFPDRSGSRHTGWLLPRNARPAAGAWQTLAIRNFDGYELTDCRGLADGSMLVLERHFRWSTWYQGVKSRLRRFTAAELQAGGVMEGEVLLDAGMEFEIDNLEGLAAHRPAKGGETVLTLISDNNFNSFLQRTVLLQFALPDAPAGQAVTRR